MFDQENLQAGPTFSFGKEEVDVSELPRETRHDEQDKPDRHYSLSGLAEAECEAPEIATITGHSRKEVEAILDAHYLGMTTKARRVRPCKAGARRRRHREPTANKNCKTIRPFQMRPGISS